MSDLAHFGVKGMKWGVRNGSSSGTSSSSSKPQKVGGKADKKWEKKSARTSTFIAVYNDTAGRMNKTEIPRINGNPKYKNLNMDTDNALRRKYLKEYSDTFTRIMNEESAKRVGTNPSGTKKLEFSVDDEGAIHYHLRDVGAKHADDEPVLKIRFDDNGYIVSFTFVSPTMSQSDATTSDTLEHFGVKGMKWGVRKSESGRSTSPGSPSEDHRKAEAARTKAGTKGLHTLSNHEMQALINRMNLEQQYSRLNQTTSTAQKGHQTAKNILAAGKTMNEVISFLNSPMGKLIKLGLKKKFGK